MIKKIVIYLDVDDPDVAENVASDMQADLQVADGVKKSWVGVHIVPKSETTGVPWVESR